VLSGINKLLRGGVRALLPVYVREYLRIKHDLFFSPKRIPRVTVRAADGCNLRCVMCHFSKDYRKGYKLKLFDLDLFRKVIFESKDWIDEVAFAASGEPLLNPNLPEMVSFASGLGIKTMVGTNGQLLTADIAEALILAGLNRLKVSIDGATAETYEKIRIGGSFSKLVDNLQRFRAIADRLNRKVTIRLNCVVSKYNMHELSMMKSTFENLGDIVSVNFPCTFGMMDDTNSYSPCNMVMKTCPMTAKILSLEPSGKALYCCGDNQNKAVIGNILNSRLIDIWNSDKYNKLRLLHFKGRQRLISLCATRYDASLHDKAYLVYLYSKQLPLQM
jgi:MoaA/NifB/PqqE/SkfB family radical SAM enzyme